MQLINLSIRGLRPFKTEPPTEIHFSETEPIDIVGDTDALGAAFDFALYGRTACPSLADHDPRNDDARCLRTRLTFRANGETWELTRTLRRRPGDRHGTPACSLRRIGPGAAPGTMIEDAQQVGEMLCRLLLPYFSRWVECETGTLQKDTAALRAARGTPGTCLCALRLAVAKSQATRKRIVSARARLLSLRNLALAEVIPFPDTSQPATRVDERASSTGAYPADSTNHADP